MAARGHDSDDEDVDLRNGVAIGIGLRARRLEKKRKGAGIDHTTIHPDDGVPWHLATHSEAHTRLLTEDDPRAPDPPGFKGHLFPPQATTLYAMLELEKCPVLRLTKRLERDRKSPALQTNRALLSEALGFGKTVALLALIRASGRPRDLPLCANAPVLSGARSITGISCSVKSSDKTVFHQSYPGFLPELSVCYSRILPLTVVAAAGGIISQWVDNTRRFTDLRYYIVENSRTLAQFEKDYRAGVMANYDMVFVKIGSVTTSFVVDGEEALKTNHRRLLEAIAAILEGVAVARLIIDDFDTIKLAAGDNFLPASFTWIVSATRRRTTAGVGPPRPFGSKMTPQDYLRHFHGKFPILAAAQDDSMYGLLSLHCDPEYVKGHIATTKTKFRRIFVKGGLAAALLRNLGVADDIVEMVNADAIGTAANNLGIEAKSPNDLINRILKDRQAKYAHAIHVLDRVAAAREHVAGLGGCEKDTKRIHKYREALKKGTEEEIEEIEEEIEGGSAELNLAFNTLEDWARSERQTYGAALERMRANIREQQCQCCMVPFTPEPSGTPDDGIGSGETAFILNCCQIVVCEPCIATEGRFINRCPNCVHPLVAARDLIRVGKEMSLEDALSDEALNSSKFEPVLEEKKVAEPKEDKDPLSALQNHKLKALVQYMKDIDIDCVRAEDYEPTAGERQGLLEGKTDTPWPADKAKKYLIFALHSESTRQISEALTKFGIENLHYKGSRSERDSLLDAFRERVNVMVITTGKDSAGLHLPFVFAGIEYGVCLDKAIRSQMRARFIRQGREFNSECVTIVNEAEEHMLNRAI